MVQQFGAQSTLAGIAAPALADIPGQAQLGQQIGRGNRSRELVGQILGSTFGGKLGALGKENPDTAMKIAEGLGIPGNDKERFQSFVGDMQAATAIVNGSGSEDALQYLAEVTDRRKQLGIDTTRLDDMIKFGTENPDELSGALNAMTDALEEQGFIQQPSGSGTAPQKDLKTLKRLQAKAERTGDPVDIEAAEKFSTRAGFDRATPQEQADIDIQKATEIEAIKTRESLESASGKQAIKKSGEFFDQIGKIREANLNVDEAIRLLKVEGASTGPIISQFPSIRSSAVKLDNVRRKMGLDIIGAVTFGALSKGELDLALATAIPDTLSPPELIEWLQERKNAQSKLSNYYEEAATFLGTPGNTIPKFLKQQKARKQIQDAKPEQKRRVFDPASGQLK